MRYYEATSTIATSPEAVWGVLRDGAGWPGWDSGVDAVEGGIAMGETVKIRSQAAPGRAFSVRVWGRPSSASPAASSSGSSQVADRDG
jgi:hypothetical protein